MSQQFSEIKLRELAENVIEQQDALDHEEETGNAVLFVHHNLRNIFPVQLVAGREGEFYKFSFEYELEVIEEKFPDEPYKARYSRNVRINAKGLLSAIGSRKLLAELD